MSHHCQNCTNCKLLQKKLAIYEKCINELHTLESKSEQLPAINDIKIEKDEFGDTVKKIESDLTESILLVERGKNIYELPMREQNVIREQDNLHNYKKTVEITKKAGNVYTVLSYVLSVRRIFFPF